MQALLRQAVDSGRLLGLIDGWEAVEAIDAAAGSDRFDPSLVLDVLIRERWAAAALSIRDQLDEITVVADSRTSISLGSRERLFADLVCVSPSSGSMVIFELKRSRATARETATELLAYEQEVRNQLPFIGRSEVALVVVSSDFSPLLDHALTSLIAWHGLRILCLEATPDGRYAVRTPSAWTTFGQSGIPADAVEVVDVGVVTHDDLSLEQNAAMLSTALDLIRADGDRDGTTGFAFSWADLLHPGIAVSPCALTVARVNPLAVGQDPISAAFLGPASSPLRAFVEAADIDEWTPLSTHLDAAVSFLSGFGSVDIEGWSTWDRDRDERRHRSDGFIRDRRALPLEFVLWGALGDHARALLARPGRASTAHGGLWEPTISLREPNVAMRLIDEVVRTDCGVWLGVQWFASLAFRLGRLRAYVDMILQDPSAKIEHQVAPLLAWAQFDLSALAPDLEAAAGSYGGGVAPPRLHLGSIDALRSEGLLDRIDELAEWVRHELIDGHRIVGRTFDVTLMGAPALDRCIEMMAPDSGVKAVLPQLVAYARHCIEEIVEATVDDPARWDPMQGLLVDTFGSVASGAPETLADRLSDEILLQEFTTGLPRLYDLLIDPLGLDYDAPTPDLDWDGLRDRMAELAERGLSAVLETDGGGAFRIALTDEPIPRVADPRVDVWVRVRSGLTSVVVRRSWADLRET